MKRQSTSSQHFTILISLAPWKFTFKFFFSARRQKLWFSSPRWRNHVIASVSEKINVSLRRRASAEVTIILKRFHINFKCDWIFILRETKQKNSSSSSCEMQRKLCLMLQYHCQIEIPWFIPVFYLIHPSHHADQENLFEDYRLDIDFLNLIKMLFDVSLHCRRRKSSSTCEYF